ncbi:MAG: signal recognition particle-docking protein FtsY [Gammaproteobacteria bacterium]|nr:signal recognition particle-docking protein FtsY [Gammaproteobacteria bacterium]
MLFKKNQNKEQETDSVWQSLKSGLNKTRNILLTDVGDLLGQASSGADEILEELETRLLLADVGINATEKIINGLKSDIKTQKPETGKEILSLLEQQMVNILRTIESPLDITTGPHKPLTILVIGVNGAGKTTTIGKLTNLYKNSFNTMIAAGDTFRAAAIEQLMTWGDRNSVPVVSRSQGEDSSAVIYDALQAARQQNIDLLIADTAGRLQNKTNLIDELKKIRRTITKFDPDLKVFTLLIIDAATGQNALNQATQFNSEIGIDGLVLTKLDGTAKGGIIFAIAESLGIPLHYIGTGESINDISPFNAQDFVSALLSIKQ